METFNMIWRGVFAGFAVAYLGVSIGMLMGWLQPPQVFLSYVGVWGAAAACLALARQ